MERLRAQEDLTETTNRSHIGSDHPCPAKGYRTGNPASNALGRMEYPMTRLPSFTHALLVVNIDRERR